jgi:hypothetical protein
MYLIAFVGAVLVVVLIVAFVATEPRPYDDEDDGEY